MGTHLLNKSYVFLLIDVLLLSVDTFEEAALQSAANSIFTAICATRYDGQNNGIFHKLRELDLCWVISPRMSFFLHEVESSFNHSSLSSSFKSHTLLVYDTTTGTAYRQEQKP